MLRCLFFFSVLFEKNAYLSPWQHIPPRHFQAERNALRSIKCLMNVRCCFLLVLNKTLFCSVIPFFLVSTFKMNGQALAAVCYVT